MLLAVTTGGMRRKKKNLHKKAAGVKAAGKIKKGPLHTTYGEVFSQDSLEISQ